MLLDPLRALADFEARSETAVHTDSERREGPGDPAAGEAREAFCRKHGHMLTEVFEAANLYLANIRAVEGQDGHTTAMNVARIIRYGFDLPDKEGWEAFRRWNAANANPPFEEGSTNPDDSLERRWKAGLINDRAAGPPGYLLDRSEYLRKIREGRALGGAPANDDWHLSATPLSAFLKETYPLPERIVGKLLKGAVCLVYGAAGSLKTWLALAVARDAAKESRRVLYVLEEGLHGKVQERFRTLGMDTDRVFLAMRQGFMLDDPGKVSLLVAKAKEIGAELIVLDPLSNIHGKEENERGEMLEISKALDRLATETGACVFVVHHANKAGGRQGRDALTADMSNLRGSSVLAGSADLMWEVRRDPDNLQRAEVHTTKNRNEAMEVPGSVRLVLDERQERVTDVEWVHGEAARQEFEARKAEVAARKREKAEDWVDQETAIIDVVAREPGIDKAGLQRALPAWGSSTISRRVDRLLEARRLTNAASGKGFALHLATRQ
jgi:hypothetical protein